MKNRLSYSLTGIGEKTIVMLHGWGLNKSAFARLERQFNTKAKCLIVDFYGFGKSGLPEDYYDTYEYAYQIFLLLKQLRLDKIVLVGHSFGGRVAIILSAVFGLDIDFLVLTSSAGLNRFCLKKSLRIAKYKLYKKMVQIGVLKSNVLGKLGSDDYKRLSPLMRCCFIKIINQDLSYILNKICIPTLLFWAKDDKDTPIWICKKLHKYIKFSTVYMCKTGGHFVYLNRSNKFKMLLDEIV
ncbi:MAG: alpha/beta hydrolase [Clostridiales bacterium]|nr:alpha/beta hydrolase [Clostridiales bacterium]